MTLEFIAAAADYKERWLALKESLRWRDVKTEPPPKSGRYMVWWIKGNFIDFRYYRKNIPTIPEWDCEVFPDKWKPLPEGYVE
jgi:hypothetical protein